MALQDVDTRSSSNKACTLFDNGSEQTLISNILTNKNNIPYDEARYSISVEATTYNTETNGKIYTVPFVENGNKVVYINAFSVNNIFKSKVGRERMNVKPGDFPHHSN